LDFAACAAMVAASGPWRTSGDWWREDGWQQDEWDLEIRFHSSRLFAGASQVPWAPRAQEHLGINFKNEQSPTSAKALPQCGLYRFYYDAILQSWFVRGMYD